MFANKPTAKPKTLKPINTNANPFSSTAVIDPKGNPKFIPVAPTTPLPVPNDQPIAPTAQQTKLDALLGSEFQPVTTKRERRQTVEIELDKRVMKPVILKDESGSTTVISSVDHAEPTWEDEGISWSWAEQTEIDQSRLGRLNWRKFVKAYLLTPEEFAVAAGHLMSQVNVSDRDLATAISNFRPVQPEKLTDEKKVIAKPVPTIESVKEAEPADVELPQVRPKQLDVSMAHRHSTPIGGTPIDTLRNLRATDVILWYAEQTNDESAAPPEGDMNFEPERDITITLPGPVPTRVEVPDCPPLCLIRDAGTPWHVCNIIKMPFQVNDSVRVFETLFDAILEIHIQYGYFGEEMTYWFARTRGTHLATTTQWGEALMWGMEYAERHHGTELRQHYVRLCNALMAHSSHARLYHKLLLDAKIMMFNVPTGSTPFSIAGKLNVGYIDYYVTKTSIWFQAVQSVSAPDVAATPQGELIDRARALMKAMSEHALSASGQVPTLTNATAALERFKREQEGDTDAIALFASILSGMHNAVIN